MRRGLCVVGGIAVHSSWHCFARHDNSDALLELPRFPSKAHWVMIYVSTCNNHGNVDLGW